jgi:nitrite reductase/ring-hydroxylating ferredoxin subunit
MRPTGWFQICWSWDLAESAVLPLRYFGRDLVAYRDTGGRVRVLDAVCRHLGASLAHGGTVVGDGIQCPFHGWVWGSDGRNVCIPYQDRPNTARRVRAWRTAELNEAVYLWHDAEGRDPLWALPSVADLGPHAAAGDFHRAAPDGRAHFRDLTVHPQLVTENAVDAHHFRFVHRTPISPVLIESRTEGPTWYSRLGFGRRWAGRGPGVAPPDDTLNTLIILWSGVGVSLNIEHVKTGMRAIAICTTPVDEVRSEIFATYWLQRTDADDVPGHYRARLDDAKASLPDDVAIWNHQRYLEPPGLATSEGERFRRLRRWAAQFYPDPQPGNAVP